MQMGCPPEPTRFAPMNWCTSAIPTPVPSYVSQAYFMGFNEPNNDSQCNISPAAAAKAWSEVMRLHPNSQLVSPATAGNGIAWFEAFFGNCTSLYGSNGCNIAYLAAHDYSCEPSHTMAYLQQLHDHFGYKVRGGTPHPSTVRPPKESQLTAPCVFAATCDGAPSTHQIWLTEFSCGDNHQHRPTSDHERYMRAVVPLLDGADFVYRYAWMSARDPSGRRGLVETVNGTAQLTQLGQIYNTL